MNDTPPVKRGRGRPRKTPLVEREPLRDEVRESPKTSKYKMRATPNWEDVDPLAGDSADRLKIDPGLIPDGMTAMWVTDSVLGQPVPQHRSEFERKGWTPVHQDDFDGQFNGMFMKKNAPGEINVEGLVLMMRPKELSDRAELQDRRRARNQVMIKEQALRGGDIPISLDTKHPSVSNRINKTMERIEVPTDK